MLGVIRKKTVVKPGSIVEIHVPELSPGSVADVIIIVNETAKKMKSLSQIIGSVKGSFATPEDADAFIRRERDAWES